MWKDLHALEGPTGRSHAESVAMQWFQTRPQCVSFELQFRREQNQCLAFLKHLTTDTCKSHNGFRQGHLQTDSYGAAFHKYTTSFLT